MSVHFVKSEPFTGISYLVQGSVSPAYFVICSQVSLGAEHHPFLPQVTVE